MSSKKKGAARPAKSAAPTRRVRFKIPFAVYNHVAREAAARHGWTWPEAVAATLGQSLRCGTLLPNFGLGHRLPATRRATDEAVGVVGACLPAELVDAFAALARRELGLDLRSAIVFVLAWSAQCLPRSPDRDADDNEGEEWKEAAA
jgi:hypothetical protein